MNIYAGLSLLATHVFFLLGIYTYRKDPKSGLYKGFSIFCALLGYLALMEFGYRQTDDFRTAYIWLKAASIWPLVMAFSVHLVLIFTQKAAVFRRKITYPLLYGPALFFSFLYLATDFAAGEFEREYWGWRYIIPENRVFYNLINTWTITLALLLLFLLFLYWYRAFDPHEKQRGMYVFFGVSISLAIGIITDIVLPTVHITIPESTLSILSIGIVFIVYGVWKYGLFILSPATAAEDIVTAMSNVLFLVSTDGTISQANPAALNLLGYTENELYGQPLEMVLAERGIIKETDFRDMSNQETTLTTREGKTIPFLLSISRVHSKNGQNIGLLCVGSDLTDHKQAEEAQKKETLIREIHHRVKNNMQVISSLLSLQSNYIAEEKYTRMIRESQDRIRSMTLIHEKLYQSRDLEYIDFREYVTDMIQQLIHVHGIDIAVTVEADDIDLNVDYAVPCGLIINELVSNCFKHAFPDKKGEITVEIHAVDETITLRVKDNGVGIPEDLDFRTTETLGLRLVTILAEDQLNGDISLVRSGGTEFCITFNALSKSAEYR
jgi:PAS domain S-box-containing protein